MKLKIQAAMSFSVFIFPVLMVFTTTSCVSDVQSESTGQSDQTGRTGSMARFQVVGDQLYALAGTHLQVYNIANPSAIAIQNSVEVGPGIETLFARGGFLYIGSETGMHVYDITDKTLPKKSSELTHMRACDPVVVQGETAFLTLRSGGNRCWNSNNELQIIDVGNPYAPVKLKTYPMANPHGLGIDRSWLFICDGYAGLKVFKVGDDFSLTLLDNVDGLDAYDVIPATGSGQTLILIASDGLRQYDYSQFPMRELSLIPIGG
jgi:hypothetical protein